MSEPVPFSILNTTLSIILSVVVAGLAYIANWEFQTINELQDATATINARQILNQDRISTLETLARDRATQYAAIEGKLGTLNERTMEMKKTIDEINRALARRP